MSGSSLTELSSVFHKITDPRDAKGVRHDFHGMLTLVFLGLLAQIPSMAWIERWAKKYWHVLGPPSDSKK